MTDQTTINEDADEPDEPERPTPTVSVPTGRDAHGFHGHMECDPQAAWMWDARRWERVR